MSKNKLVALILGGSGGIGLAVASLLSKNSFDVVLAARSDDKLVEAANRVGCHHLNMDVTKSENVKLGFATLSTQFGRLDLLVNAVGMRAKMTSSKRMMPITRMTVDDWEAQNEIHGLGCFLCSQQALKIMRKQGAGNIVNIASIAAKAPLVPGYSAYGAAKAAMVNFTKSLNKEGNRYGIRATALSPTYVDTPLLAGVDMESKQMMSPDVVAETVLYLSRLPSNVVIQEIVLDTLLAHK